MQWQRLDNLGQVGLVADIAEQDIPASGFSVATNVWFRDGASRPAPGHVANYTPTAAPYYATAGRYSNNPFYIYVGPNSGTWEAYSIYGGSHSDITPNGGITATANNNWTSAVLHGIMFLNNGTDAPWYTDGPNSTLSAIPSFPASTTCNSLRAYKNFLVMLDVTADGTRYPQLVRWSSSADPGSLPTSWDITDPTVDAGSNPLSETPDYCIDGATLRDTFVIYKESTTWLMQYVGPPYIFRFQSLFSSSGIMARNCVAEYKGTHVVLTQNDVIQHDGQTWKSIANGVVRNTLFNEINNAYLKRSFVFVDNQRDLAWICIPTTGEYPDKAYLYHFPTGTWGTRQLPTVAHMAAGWNSGTGGATWDSDTGTWDSDAEAWGGTEGTFDGEIVMSCPGGNLFTVDTYQFNGVSPNVLMERSGLDLGMPERKKMVGRVRPRVSATAGTTLMIQVGTQDRLTDTITWGSVKAFVVGTNRDVFIFQRGRYIAYRVYAAEGVEWKLEGLEFQIDDSGEY